MATTLPENNGVVRGDNNIGKGNDRQASSAATPNNILNLSLPTEQYIGINYKGIASSPVTNTATGLAPPVKAIEEAHTLATLNSGINSQPVREPTRDDSDSLASVFQQQTQDVSLAG